MRAWLLELYQFIVFLRKYTKSRGYVVFAKFEVAKDLIVDLLYKRRGKYARPFLHFGTIGLVFGLVIFGPMIFTQSEEQKEAGGSRGVLTTVSAYNRGFATLQAEEVKQYRGGEIVTHVVKEGETLSSIARLYGLNPATIEWENNLTANAKIKPGQELKILPVDGVRHKVARGETIYSVGKKYGLDDESQVQSIVDYPFNEFLNDETFELASGQYLMIPGGVRPEPSVTLPKFALQLTPDAGSVTATGNFVWPASGRLTQRYSFYHKAYDIASRDGGPILAADSGTVLTAGWPDNSGYGNRVVIDHGNGFVTLYGHLSVINVHAGQRVNRGDKLGMMGSTGRSTGTHLHFEIKQGGALLNPANYLR